MAEEENKSYGKSYGKRPLWQWLLLYTIIGIVVYGLIYYFVLAKNGNYSSQNNNSSAPSYNYSP